MATISVDELQDKIGVAHHIGTFDSNSPEWHALRLRGIGGSDVAGIVGLSPWNSPFKVWAVKTGRMDDDFTPSEAAEWGNRLEPIIIDKLEEQFPEYKIYRNVGTWANNERPWQLANPDALYETPDGRLGVIEIKTSRYEDDWLSGQPPVHYQTQVQWYSQALGLDAPIIVAALFSGSKFRVFEVESDKFQQDTFLAEVEKFRNNYILEPDRKPEFDGSLATYETVREINPDIEDAEIELGDLGVHYTLALADFEQAETYLNEMKSRVLDAMGKCKRGLAHSIWIVTRQARGTGRPYLINKKNGN